MCYIIILDVGGSENFITRRLRAALNRRTVRPFTETVYTRCCNNTICPPEDAHSTARNMSRIIM